MIDHVDRIEILVDLGRPNFADGLSQGCVFGDTDHQGIHDTAG